MKREPLFIIIVYHDGYYDWDWLRENWHDGEGNISVFTCFEKANYRLRKLQKKFPNDKLMLKVLKGDE